jgi:hypothetical protein
MTTAPAVETLPELANVYWRPRVSERRLVQSGRLWTLSAIAHVVPLVGAAFGLAALNPLTAPVGLVLLAHAWAIPELYAARGAKVVRRGVGGETQSDRVALGLLGDLVDHRARELLASTGLALERGTLGVWLVGEAGALLVRPGGHRVYCYCVRVPGPALPSGDRIAHLLLALRTDECGFATVANLAFSGAAWRVRRRLPESAREALTVAARDARSTS